MTAGYRLKRRRGFFAAGAEFARALGVLGDGAFKLFAHVCLEADRATGRLAFDRGELADRLGKSRSALGRHLRELVRAGVCELETAPNQHRHSVLAVRAEYWPYRATEVGVTAPAGPWPHDLCRGRAAGLPRPRLRAGRLRPGRRASRRGLAGPRRTPGNRPARHPARLRAQVAGTDRAARHAARAPAALLRTVAPGSPAREIPRHLLATSGVQPRSLRGTTGSIIPRLRRAVPGQKWNRQARQPIQFLPPRLWEEKRGKTR